MVLPDLHIREVLAHEGANAFEGFVLVHAGYETAAHLHLGPGGDGGLDAGPRVAPDDPMHLHGGTAPDALHDLQGVFGAQGLEGMVPLEDLHIEAGTEPAFQLLRRGFHHVLVEAGDQGIPRRPPYQPGVQIMFRRLEGEDEAQQTPQAGRRTGLAPGDPDGVADDDEIRG